MPNAQGTVRCQDGSRIEAVFTLDEGIRLAFAGSVSPRGAAWESGEATLTYSSEGDLTGQRVFKGSVSRDNVSLELDNGPTLEGRLKPPGVGTPQAFTGSGTWRVSQ
ncbi:hypothetical protein ACF1AO_30390 [Streptomyces longwoodensis]|uniref:hypothetical protein n=1 Tax=Streptomyces longwoodensis TaxID=68231 RepID=UPI0036FCCB5F